MQATIGSLSSGVVVKRDFGAWRLGWVPRCLGAMMEDSLLTADPLLPVALESSQASFTLTPFAIGGGGFEAHQLQLLALLHPEGAQG